MLAQSFRAIAVLGLLCCANSLLSRRTGFEAYAQFSRDGGRVIDRALLVEGTAEAWQHRGHLPMPNLRTDTAIAVRLLSPIDAEGFPREAAWETAPPIRFDTDWQGKNADAQRATEVRLLWTPEFLYLRFDAGYRTITVFPDAEPSGRRDHLWDRDVCEVFLQPDAKEPRAYKEIEVAPNGFWIDLDIAPTEKHDLKSGLRRRVNVDAQKKTWRAELALPMKSLVANFAPSVVWRVNFYRVEGEAEPRFYSAWRPTGTPQPSFHVPEAFGGLVFAEAASKIQR